MDHSFDAFGDSPATQAEDACPYYFRDGVKVLNTHSGRGRAMTIVVYSRQGCHLCDVAHQQLAERQARFDFDLSSIDVDSDPGLTASYGERVPVVVIDGRERFSGRISAPLLDRLLTAEGRLRR